MGFNICLFRPENASNMDKIVWFGVFIFRGSGFQCDYNDTKIVKMRMNFWFLKFYTLSITASTLICRKFLTSLRLFAQKKYLRFRRAPRASTITRIVWNSQYVCENGTNALIFGIKCAIFEVFILSITALILSCRKILTSLRLFAQKKYLRFRRAPRACTITRKVCKLEICVYIEIKCIKIWSILHDSGVFIFWTLQSWLWSAEKI